MRIPVTLHDLPFNTGLDSDGVKWTLTRLTGWAAPAGDQSLVGFASRHGAAMGRSRLGPRGLVLEGVVRAPDRETHWAAYHRLLGVVANLQETRWLQVDEPVPKRVAVVRGGGGADPVDIRLHNELVFEFRADVVALDPLKYAVEELSVTVPAGGSVAVAGIGTATAPARVTTGGQVNVTNQATGARLSTTSTVPDGTVFDSATRTARGPGGASRFAALAPGFAWVEVIPGEQTIRNDGTTDLTLTWANAWV